MADKQRRLTREDLLEAMRKEFDQGERYAGALAYSLDDDLHQTRQSVGLGVSLEGWATARGVPLAYALGRSGGISIRSKVGPGSLFSGLRPFLRPICYLTYSLTGTKGGAGCAAG